jgi:prepilin-type processing-associated H-X9-DG protein
MIVVAIGGSVNTNIFLCPMDRRIGGPAFPYSYTMVSDVYPGGSGKDVNHGITSWFNGTAELQFKQSQIQRASDKLMLAEEKVTSSGPNDGRFQLVQADGVTPDDSLSDRHGKKADITFADGHVAVIVPQLVSTNAKSYQPDN